MQPLLYLSLANIIGNVLGMSNPVQGCPGPKVLRSGFDVTFYSYPLNDHRGYDGSWYFLGGYKEMGSITGNTTGVTDISHKKAAIDSLSHSGEIYGETVQITNFGMVLTGWFYAEQSGNYVFTVPFEDEGISIQFGRGKSCCGDFDDNIVTEDIAWFTITQPSPNRIYSAQLTEGLYYPMRLVYFNALGGSKIQVPWTMPDGTKRNDFKNVRQIDTKDNCPVFTTVTSGIHSTEYTTTRTDQTTTETDIVIVSPTTPVATVTTRDNHAFAVNPEDALIVIDGGDLTQAKNHTISETSAVDILPSTTAIAITETTTNDGKWMTSLIQAGSHPFSQGDAENITSVNLQTPTTRGKSSAVVVSNPVVSNLNPLTSQKLNGNIPSGVSTHDTTPKAGQNDVSASKTMRKGKTSNWKESSVTILSHTGTINSIRTSPTSSVQSKTSALGLASTIQSTTTNIGLLSPMSMLSLSKATISKPTYSISSDIASGSMSTGLIKSLPTISKVPQSMIVITTVVTPTNNPTMTTPYTTVITVPRSSTGTHTSVTSSVTSSPEMLPITGSKRSSASSVKTSGPQNMVVSSDKSAVNAVSSEASTSLFARITGKKFDNASATVTSVLSSTLEPSAPKGVSTLSGIMSVSYKTTVGHDGTETVSPLMSSVNFDGNTAFRGSMLSSSESHTFLSGASFLSRRDTAVPESTNALHGSESSSQSNASSPRSAVAFPVTGSASPVSKTAFACSNIPCFEGTKTSFGNAFPSSTIPGPSVGTLSPSGSAVLSFDAASAFSVSSTITSGNALSVSGAQPSGAEILSASHASGGHDESAPLQSDSASPVGTKMSTFQPLKSSSTLQLSDIQTLSTLSSFSSGALSSFSKSIASETEATTNPVRTSDYSSESSITFPGMPVWSSRSIASQSEVSNSPSGTVSPESTTAFSGSSFSTAKGSLASVSNTVASYVVSDSSDSSITFPGTPVWSSRSIASQSEVSNSPSGTVSPESTTAFSGSSFSTAEGSLASVSNTVASYVVSHSFENTAAPVDTHSYSAIQPAPSKSINTKPSDLDAASNAEYYGVGDHSASHGSDNDGEESSLSENATTPSSTITMSVHQQISSTFAPELADIDGSGTVPLSSESNNAFTSLTVSSSESFASPFGSVHEPSITGFVSPESTMTTPGSIHSSAEITATSFGNAVPSSEISGPSESTSAQPVNSDSSSDMAFFSFKSGSISPAYVATVSSDNNSGYESPSGSHGPGGSEKSASLESAAILPVSMTLSTPLPMASPSVPQFAASDASGTHPGLANRAVKPRWSFVAFVLAASIFFF